MAEKKVTISVVVPAYNAEAFLEQCVRSVQEQTATDWELLIVENGSTDETYALAQRFAHGDTRIRVLQSKKGVSYARNVGIQQATGEYITFLDADDWLLPDALSYFRRMAHKHPAADIIVAATDRQAQNSTPAVYTEVTMERALVRFMRQPTRYLTAWGKLYRTAFLQQSQVRFDIRLTHAEDSDYLIRLLGDCRRLVLTDYPVYHYFLNPYSAVRSGRVDLAEKYRISLECTRSRLPFGEATKKNYPFYVLDNLLVLLAHDTFHHRHTPAQQRRRAAAVLKIPIFRWALEEAPIRHATFIKRMVLAMAKGRRLHLLQLAVWARQLQNRHR